MLSSTAIPRDTNRSKTAYDLVRRLVLKGKRIVADAAYCQRDICETIVEKKADYLVTVKQNQLQLLRDIEQAFVISRRRQDRFVAPRDLVRNSIVIAQFEVTDNQPSAVPQTLARTRPHAANERDELRRQQHRHQLADGTNTNAKSHHAAGTSNSNRTTEIRGSPIGPTPPSSSDHPNFDKMPPNERLNYHQDRLKQLFGG